MAPPALFKLKPRDDEGATATACFAFTLSGPACADAFIRAINEALGSPHWALYSRVGGGDFVRLPAEQLSRAAEAAAAHAGAGFADQLLAEAEGSATVLWWEVRKFKFAAAAAPAAACLPVAPACSSGTLPIPGCLRAHLATLWWSLIAYPWPMLVQPVTPAATREHRPPEGGSTGGHSSGGSGRRPTPNSSEASGEGKKRPLKISPPLAAEARQLMAKYCAQQNGEQQRMGKSHAHGRRVCSLAVSQVGCACDLALCGDLFACGRLTRRALTATAGLYVLLSQPGF